MDMGFVSEWAFSSDERKKLMLVPRTAKGFRATVSTLQSLDGRKGVSFHTFSLPKDHCVHLLVKNLGRHMPEDVVWEEFWRIWASGSREFSNSAPGTVNRKPPKPAPFPCTLLCP
jgi:hypothetical protein